MEEEASSQQQTVSSFLQNLLFTQNPVNAINEGESCDIIPHHPDLPVSSLTPGQDPASIHHPELSWLPDGGTKHHSYSSSCLANYLTAH